MFLESFVNFFLFFIVMMVIIFFDYYLALGLLAIFASVFTYMIMLFPELFINRLEPLSKIDFFSLVSFGTGMMILGIIHIIKYIKALKNSKKIGTPLRDLLKKHEDS